MIEYVLYMIAVWAFIGFISAFLDLYVFFRGPEHMIFCHINHKDEMTKKVGHHMLKDYTERKVAFYITFFVIYTILGLFTTFVLISDFFKFTFDVK